MPKKIVSEEDEKYQILADEVTRLCDIAGGEQKLAKLLHDEFRSSQINSPSFIQKINAWFITQLKTTNAMKDWFEKADRESQMNLLSGLTAVAEKVGMEYPMPNLYLQVMAVEMLNIMRGEPSRKIRATESQTISNVVPLPQRNAR